MIAVLRMGILHGTMDIKYRRPSIYVALPCKINFSQATDVPECPDVPILRFGFKNQISQDICEYEFEGMGK